MKNFFCNPLFKYNIHIELTESLVEASTIARSSPVPNDLELSMSKALDHSGKTFFIVSAEHTLNSRYTDPLFAAGMIQSANLVVVFERVLHESF